MGISYRKSLKKANGLRGGLLKKRKQSRFLGPLQRQYILLENIRTNNTGGAFTNTLKSGQSKSGMHSLKTTEQILLFFVL